MIRRDGVRFPVPRIVGLAQIPPPSFHYTRQALDMKLTDPLANVRAALEYVRRRYTPQWAVYNRGHWTITSEERLQTERLQATGRYG